MALAVGRFLSSEFWLFAAACGVATARIGHLRRPLLSPRRPTRAARGSRPGQLHRGHGSRSACGAGDRLAIRPLRRPCSAQPPDPGCRCPRAGFTDSAVLAIVGVLIWGGCWSPRFHSQSAGCRSRALQQTHYRLWSFAAVQGAAAIAGGTLAGALYDRSLPVLIATVAVLQLTALVLLMVTLCRRHHG